MSETPAVVTVAVNGYALIHPAAVLSHRRFARRHGYRSVQVTARRFRVDRADAAWMKLDLLAATLRDGAGWALMVDADAVISRRAPALDTLAGDDGADVFAVRGASGRWNSGVLVVRNTASSRALVEAVVASRASPVPDDTWNGWQDWGENGHVIHALDRYPGVRELGLEWNNTLDPDLPDFVRHRTGPLARRPALPERQWRRLVRHLVRRRPALAATDADAAARGRPTHVIADALR